ncbi:hypothetical protein L0337_32965 [candidate division KSB1 bacterium]|nr:hypothetical protein [candidate division KSB1 bacterium]
MIKHHKLISLLNEITAEKGELTLFGLFLREDAPNVWDLVVAAPWIEKNRSKALHYIVEKIKAHLTMPELLSLSKVVILESINPLLKAILDAIPPGQDQVEWQNVTFINLELARAYIFKAKRPQKSGKMQTTKKPRQRTAPARRRLVTAP